MFVKGSQEELTAGERMRGHKRLRLAFGIAFSLQIVLMILAFSVSSVLQKSNNELSRFGAEASSLKIHFQTISSLSQEIARESSENNPSQAFISGMQAKVLLHVEQLEQGLMSKEDLAGSHSWFAEDARLRIEQVRHEINPSLNRFLERSWGLARSSPSEIRARYNRISTTDLVSAASGTVLSGLEEITELSENASATLSRNLYILNILINSLSIMMIAVVGFFIVLPALQNQLSATLREDKVNADLRDTNRQLRDSEARAVALYHEAKEADRAKTEFLAVMSHELRTPLNAINGFSEVLALEMFGPHASQQYREYSNDIHTSGTHLLSIIDDILDFSRMNINEMQLSEDRVDVCNLCLGIIRMLRNEVDNAGIVISFVKSISADCVLYIDQKLVQQALINVVNNAVKFSDADTQITIKLMQLEDGEYCISVMDEGSGISDELLPKIGTPFTQEEGALSRSKGGLGLGLAITKAIMVAHDGRLMIEKREKAGTNVRLTFPLERAFKHRNTVEETLLQTG